MSCDPRITAVWRRGKPLRMVNRGLLLFLEDERIICADQLGNIQMLAWNFESERLNTARKPDMFDLHPQRLESAALRRR